MAHTTVKTHTIHDGAIKIITINRPHSKNAVDRYTAKLLYEEFLLFEEDPTQEVCILAGAGGTFCSGADLKAFTNEAKEGHERQLNPVEGNNIGPMGPSRLQVKKPVIAAVSGYAVAGGLELSLLADMRVMEKDAVFGVYCRRWGVPLIDGGTVRLQAIVGYGRAMDMILTGRSVHAREALSMGLANRVVGKGKALEESVRIAKQLLKFPSACMLVDRANMAYSAFEATSFEDAMRHEFDNGAKVLKEAEAGAALFAAGAGRHGGDGKL